MKGMKHYLVPVFLATFLLLWGARGSRAAERTQQDVVAPAPQEVTAFVDHYVAQHMEEAHAPGLVVVVVRHEEVLLAKGYGLADLQTGRPMTAQTHLRVGSASKPLTSAAVLQLAASDGLSLATPVSDILPALPLEDDGYGPSGTVSQFLALKGGYADTVVQTHAPTLEQWQPLPDYLADHLPARVLPPGKVHVYNSWEHALLGQALAQVTGLPFAEAMETLLFAPLGMAQTTFRQPLPADIEADLAQGYAYVGGGANGGSGGYDEVPLDYVKLSPGIAAVTTGEDMGRFMRALLDDGHLDGERVLDEATVRGMLQRQEEVHALSRGRTYGFSELTIDGRAVLYQDGNGIGHGNRILLVPEQGLGIFLSTNHRPLAGDVSPTPAYQFMRDLSTALVERYVPASAQEEALRAPLPDAAERAARYEGHYRLAGTPQEDFFKLGALLDNVDVRDNGEGTISIGSGRYQEVAPNLFQSLSDPGFYVVFVENDEGAVQWLTFGGTGSYEKVQWYEAPTFHLGLLGALLLVFLATVFVLPFSQNKHWSVWLMALLNVLFLAGLAVMMVRADLVLFFKTIPPATRALFLLPWLSGALALTLPVVLWRFRGSRRLRALLALNVPAMVGFVWFVWYWRLAAFGG